MDLRIQRLLAKQVYIGTSSWKYEGWKDLLYKEKYTSIKQFNDTCLHEYGHYYPTVGVDHTFYTWPTVPLFAKYMEQTPEYFRFGMKATEKLTIWQYPKHRRYGKEAGTKNDHFLDAGLFREKFLEPLRPYREKIGPIMLEFAQFFPGTISSGSEFTERLDKFFKGLKGETDFQFAVEIRNKNWLKTPYFQMLVDNGASHVFNSWTRMPQIVEQLAMTENISFPMLVSRVLLNPGTTYADAVEAFSPYDRIQAEQPEVRKAVALLILRAIRMGIPAYVFVNNRCEGSAPQTISGIINQLEKDV